MLTQPLVLTGASGPALELRCPQPGATSLKEALGAILTLMGGILGAGVAFAVATQTNRNQRRIEKDKQAHEQQLDRIKAQLEFAIELDKDLLGRRAKHYEDLVRRTGPLPRYPANAVLNPAEAYELASSLKDWYFTGAGIYMTPETKQFYFDLQDGLRVALAKAQKIITFTVPSPDADLRNAFGREDGWTAPPALRALLPIEVPPGAGPLPPEVVEYLTRLASRLRTELTKELLSRRKVDAIDPFAEPPHRL